MIKFSHISDTHATFPVISPEAEFVIHTGDFCPNLTDEPNISLENRRKEILYQTDWLQSQTPVMQKWLDGRDLLIVEGNHDFIDLAEVLQKHGVKNCFSLTNQLVNYRELNLYGFPYIPYINGAWNWERFPTEMRKEIQKMLDSLCGVALDILAAHAPIKGILDVDLPYGEFNFGNQVMASCLIHNIIHPWPRYYLHGHIHGSPGMFETQEMVVSNAATTQHVLTIEN